MILPSKRRFAMTEASQLTICSGQKFLRIFSQKEQAFLFCRHVSWTFCPGWFRRSSLSPLFSLFANDRPTYSHTKKFLLFEKASSPLVNLKPDVTTYTLILYRMSWTLTAQPCECVSRNLTLTSPLSLVHRLQVYILNSDVTTCTSISWPLTSPSELVHYELWRHHLYL